MLLEPDKLPSLTTSYRPISLISSIIIQLFERVIDQRLRPRLENIGFLNKHQPGFRRAKSTDDYLFRLSQSTMVSFNRGELVVAAFLDVEKGFDNVWGNGLRYKILQLDFSTKMTRWLSDFLVGRVIQVNVNKQNSLSLFADDTAQWAKSLNVRFAAKKDFLNLAMWHAKWRIQLNPEKTKVIRFFMSKLARKTEPNLKLYVESLKVYP